MRSSRVGSARFRPLVVIAVGGAVIAVVGFGVPIAAVLTAGLFLMCPLMMLGMHGGHGRGSHGSRVPGEDRERPPHHQHVESGDRR